MSSLNRYQTVLTPEKDDPAEGSLRKINGLLANTRGVTPTNPATNAITAGGTSQTLFAANASRRHFFFQNISDSAMWLNPNGTAAADAPSIYVPAGASYEPFVAPTTAISVFCATTGKKFTAWEA